MRRISVVTDLSLGQRFCFGLPAVIAAQLANGGKVREPIICAKHSEGPVSARLQ
jgi:hypothetical protein